MEYLRKDFKVSNYQLNLGLPIKYLGGLFLFQNFIAHKNVIWLERTAYSTVDRPFLFFGEERNSSKHGIHAQNTEQGRIQGNLPGQE